MKKPTFQNINSLPDLLSYKLFRVLLLLSKRHGQKQSQFITSTRLIPKVLGVPSKLSFVLSDFHEILSVVT